MQYCGERGIAHSEFASWDDHSRDAALSWLIWSRESCSSCGTRPDSWDPTKGGDRHAYHAEFAHCRGCEVREQADEQLTNAPKNAFRRGTRVVLRPKPREA